MAFSIPYFACLGKGRGKRGFLILRLITGLTYGEIRVDL